MEYAKRKLVAHRNWRRGMNKLKASLRQRLAASGRVRARLGNDAAPCVRAALLKAPPPDKKKHSIHTQSGTNHSVPQALAPKPVWKLQKRADGSAIRADDPDFVPPPPPLGGLLGRFLPGQLKAARADGAALLPPANPTEQDISNIERFQTRRASTQLQELQQRAPDFHVDAVPHASPPLRVLGKEGVVNPADIRRFHGSFNDIYNEG